MRSLAEEADFPQLGQAAGPIGPDPGNIAFTVAMRPTPARPIGRSDVQRRWGGHRRRNGVHLAGELLGSVNGEPDLPGGNKTYYDHDHDGSKDDQFCFSFHNGATYTFARLGCLSRCYVRLIAASFV